MQILANTTSVSTDIITNVLIHQYSYIYIFNGRTWHVQMHVCLVAQYVF